MNNTKKAAGTNKIKKSYIAVVVLFLAVMGAAIFVNQKFADTEEGLHAQRVMAEDATIAGAEKYYGEATFVNASSVSETVEQNAAQADMSSGEYFSQARLNRETAREKALSAVKETLGSAELSEKAKTEAALLAAKTAERIEQEANIENLIKAKGFKDCMVYLDGESASVVVQSDGLTANQAVQIKEIVSGGAEDCGEIKIIEVK